MGTRKITFNDRSVTGSFNSDKQEKRIDFESKLERDFYSVLEFDKSVKTFLEQPLGIEYRCDKGINRIYTPDVLVTFVNPNRQPWLCEVKYKADVKENFETYRSKFLAAIKLCLENNWKFKLIDESIRDDYFRNAQFLLPYSKVKYNPAQELEIINFLHTIQVEKGYFTPIDFRDKYGVTFEVKAIAMAVFWKLVLDNDIIFIHDQPLSMNTEMWLK
jgi:hypothetical protein